MALRAGFRLRGGDRCAGWIDVRQTCRWPAPAAALCATHGGCGRGHVAAEGCWRRSKCDAEREERPEAHDGWCHHGRTIGFLRDRRRVPHRAGTDGIHAHADLVCRGFLTSCGRSVRVDHCGQLRLVGMDCLGTGCHFHCRRHRRWTAWRARSGSRKCAQRNAQSHLRRSYFHRGRLHASAKLACIEPRVTEKESLMEYDARRRMALIAMGATAGGLIMAQTSVTAAESKSWMPDGASSLRALTDRLAKAKRRRDFKTVPMILVDKDQWDHEALNEIIAYKGSPKQVWDNTDLDGPWLNLMRNSLNAQIWSFKHPYFLAVSATHGMAHLALFDQATWDKYQLAKLGAGKQTSNTFIIEQKAGSADPKNFEDPNGAFSPHDNSIPALQRRGVVFLACHNAIWETAEKLMNAGLNPDNLSQEQLSAELTNHLVDGVVLTPGAVATLPELQLAGFQYAK